MRIRKPERARGQDLRDLPCYSIPETAAFLAIPSRTLSEWFSGRNRLFAPAGDYASNSLLSFKDITQAYMVYVLRKHHRFPYRVLQESLRNIRKETRSRYPLFDNDVRIFAHALMFDKPARGEQNRQTINVSRGRQLAINEIVDMFSKRILQDSQGRPIRMFPWRDFLNDNLSRPVSIDPHVVSGRLVVTGTRIPASALLGMKLSGKTDAYIAGNYGLDTVIVEKVLRHLDPIPKVA